MNKRGALAISHLAMVLVGVAGMYGVMRGCEQTQPPTKVQRELAAALAAADEAEAAAQEHREAAQDALRREEAARQELAVAERERAAQAAVQAAAGKTIQYLRQRVREAERPADERDELVAALEADNARLREIDLYNQDALTAAISGWDAAADRAKAAEAQAVAFEDALSKAKPAMEKADKVISKGRRRVAGAAVGGVVAGSLLAIGIVYAVK